jgi:predicted O-methyltransferase YrrM
MDKRIELLQACDSTFFTIKKNYLRSPGESGYLIYRILRPILKVRYYFFRKFNNPCPWLSPSSVRFLKTYLTKDMVGLEFGSGISTLFTAPKVKQLISVEHNKEWFEMITNRFENDGIKNVDYRFIAQNDSNLFSNTTFEMTEKLGFEVRKDYVNYYMTVESIPNNSLDFLLVDGRARPECLYYALPKMKKNGLIILDNSERAHYKIAFEFMKEFPVYTTTNGLTETTFWFLNEN